jgi:hypothetical protein
MHLHGITRSAALAGLVWLATACGDPAVDNAIASVDQWEIEASAPTITGTTVNGSFAARGEGMRAYGACLLADLHGGKPCETDADCATGAVVTLVDGHVEYCAAPPGATKTCWTRNGADAAWCNKMPPPGRAAGTFTTPGVDAAVLPGRGSSTRWVAYACLNAGTYPTFTDGPRPPCASGDPAAAAYKASATSAVTTFTTP